MILCHRDNGSLHKTHQQCLPVHWSTSYCTSTTDTDTRLAFRHWKNLSRGQSSSVNRTRARSFGPIRFPILLINKLAEAGLMRQPSRSHEEEGLLAHVITISNDYSHEDQFVRTTFTQSTIRLVEVSFPFLEGVPDHESDWKCEERFD
jgi:hypothetical protein